MSLDFDLTKIKNFKTVCYDTRTTEPTGAEADDGWRPDKDAPGTWIKLRSVTTVIIFKTMAVGMGAITEKNLPEFLTRKHVLDGFDGFDLVGPNRGRHVTEDEVRAHTGLTTNVRTEPLGQWAARVLKYEIVRARARLTPGAAVIPRSIL